MNTYPVCQEHVYHSETRLETLRFISGAAKEHERIRQIRCQPPSLAAKHIVAYVSWVSAAWSCSSLAVSSLPNGAILLKFISRSCLRASVRRRLDWGAKFCTMRLCEKKETTPRTKDFENVQTEKYKNNFRRCNLEMRSMKNDLENIILNIILVL